jgi:polyisoprenoid-binding protein YceI
MKTLFLAIGTILMTATGAVAQKYFTKSGKISFFSQAMNENIEAENKSAVSIFDATTGTIECQVLMTGFEFEKDLMQKHFNENYVESSKYPKSVFKGTITNMAKIDLKKDGVYDADVKGTLELHGVKKEVKAKAKFTVKGGKVSATCEFDIKLEDYKIERPTVVKDKVADSIKIMVSASYDELKK